MFQSLNKLVSSKLLTTSLMPLVAKAFTGGHLQPEYPCNAARQILSGEML